MKCRNCQFENPPGMKFCNECGSKLEVICPHCSQSNLAGSKFCGECGQSLTSPAEGMLRKMGMDYWLGKAQEALARL